MSLISHTPAWKTLSEHWNEIGALRMRDLFEQDPRRADRFSLEQCGIFLDYSKNLITERTMQHLMELARAADLAFWGDSLLRGDKVNNTEGRAVLHMALRNLGYRDYQIDGVDVMPGIRSVLARMRSFSDDVRMGRWLGYTGQPVTDVVNIGIGGSDLGPLMVTEALRPYWQEGLRAQRILLLGAGKQSELDSKQYLKICEQAFSSLNPADTLLSPGVGMAVFAAWVLLAIAGAAIVLKRRDA